MKLQPINTHSLTHSLTRREYECVRCAFLLLLICVANYSLAQFPGSIPPQINQHPFEAIHQNFNTLMANPDTSLSKEKKYAQRWMAYTYPYLEVRDGELTNEVFAEAMRATHSSTCTNDPAEWESDGPVGMPDWSLGGLPQTSSGWVEAVYNHPTNIQTILIGTRTSGILRTENGGQNWSSVTDNLPFPVLGVRQMIGVPGNPDHVVAITGTDWIKGNVIYTTNAGNTWNEVIQPLPQFYWMDFHPTINGLVFATSNEFIFYSNNYGIEWNILGSPSQYEYSHSHFDKIIVFANRIFFNTAYIYNGIRSELYEGSLTFNSNNIQALFTGDISQDIMSWAPTGYLTQAIRFSNKVNERFYLQIRLGSNLNYTIRSIDEGDSFQLINTSIIIGLTEKNELITSINDPDTYYWGSVKNVKKFSINSPVGSLINGTSGNNGHHDDYRCSQILTYNGQERLVFGHDGGIGLVENGLATTSTISSINGDLSINLIHAFDVHERTGKTVFGFQDHFMISRDIGNIYSPRFLHEGSFAMAQQLFPNAIVGEYVTSGIRDKPLSENPIVATENLQGFPGSLAATRTYLYGYQTHYRHYPERFARGLGVAGGLGGVALNRAKLVSDISQIPNCLGAVGPVAVCERNPTVLYAGENDRANRDHIFFKSVDDGVSWLDLSLAEIINDVYPNVSMRVIAAYLGIRALAVNHNNSNLMYVGLGGTFQQNQQPYPEAFRVLRSTDGGESFIDYSEGLPAIPLERLLTIDSENELIFCGTSAGVYYRTASMSQWECFSNGLPRVMITGMKYDYCNNMLYVSTYGRGLWKTPVNLTVQNTFIVEINENTLWDTDRVMHDNVLIAAGNTLTITAKVEMGKMKTIRIEPNARLVVDGGHITNFCNSRWAGIEVHGVTDEHQYAHSGGQYHQGRAIFKNGAVIENAWQGVMNWNPADWGSRGGIIQATNTTFRNNRIDAIFMSYQNFAPTGEIVKRPEQSFFRLCNFDLNDDYLDDPNQIPPRPRITMWRTDRLRIQGCNFTNSQTVDASENRSKAILSHDANYLVTEYCASLTYLCPEQNNIPNRFTGWHKAIEALETTSSRPIQVRNSVFDENMIGVELGGADFSQIYKNIFNLGGHPVPYENEPTIDDENHLGIFSNETYHFSIEENTLTRPAEGAPYEGHGVLVFNSQGANNVVYNNDLSNLKTGINGWQVNRNINTEGGAQPYYAGLQYICNQNQQNDGDFEVSRTGIESDFGWNNNGIRLGQGSSNPPRAAANTFSAGNPDPLVFTHFTINSYGIYGYFHFGSGGPSTNEIGPGDMGIIPINTTNNCPSNYTTGIQTGLTGKTQLLQKKAEYEGMLYAYNQIIDNGNTPATVTEVELTWPQQAWQLRDQLMQRAPYNSETVLIAAIDRNIMPHAMLLEVLLANPDALRSGNVIRRAETVPSPPMPQYMIDLLWAARNQSTLRTAMESTMAELHMEVERSQKIIITQKAFADSTYSAPDSTLYYLSKVKTVEGNYSRAAALAERHQYAQAIALVDSMLINYRLSTERIAEMAALKNLYGLLSSAHGGGKTIANLSPTEISSLRNIAENSTAGLAAKKAQNALCFHYQICYDAQGQPKNNAAPHKPQSTYEELLARLNTVTAYPNPSDQYVTIAYTLLHAKEATQLLVYDTQGRQIESRQLGEAYEGQQLIDTSKMADGVYLFQIVQEAKKVSDGKFVVTH